MNPFASALIDAMGGLTVVSGYTKAPVSTVNNWRRKHMTRSRLDHLQRVVIMERLPVDVDALAAEHGVRLDGADGKGGVADHGADDIAAAPAPSAGNTNHLSASVLA